MSILPETRAAIVARGGALVIAALGAACVSAPTDAGFEDVATEVERRTGQRVVWRRDAEASAEADREVDALRAGELTVERAVRIALLSSPALQATFEELGIARADLIETGLFSNPSLGVQARRPEGGGSIALELDLVQELVELLSIPLRRRVAEAGLEAAKLRVTAAALDLAADVTEAWYEAAAAAQLLELRRIVLQATRAALELAVALHEAGNLRDLDLAAARATHAQADADVRRADLDLSTSHERVTVLLGLTSEEPRWRWPLRLPVPPAETPSPAELERLAVEHSVALAASRWELERVARRSGLARSTRRLADAEAGAAAERENGEWSVGPSVRVPLPLVDRGQGVLTRAAAEARRAQARLASVEAEVRSAARAAASRLATAEASERLYRESVLPLRTLVREETHRQYNAMQVDAFDLLSAKEREIEAGIRYVEALRDYWLARAEVERLASGASARGARAGSRGTDAAWRAPRDGIAERGSDGGDE